MQEILAIGIFGVLGVMSRYGAEQLAQRFSLPVPYPTLGINVLGSFLAGVLYVIGTERGSLPTIIRVGAMVGFLGGFTTFSAYSLQGVLLAEKKGFWESLLYSLGSPILGFIAALFGLWLTRKIR